MVRVSPTPTRVGSSRHRRLLALDEQQQHRFKPNKNVARSVLQLGIFILLCTIGSLHFLVPNRPDDPSTATGGENSSGSHTKIMASSSGSSILAAAHSAQRILSTSKPFLVYGTAWKKEMTAHYVNQAVHSGFRFIDTAAQPKHYNEAGVGEGWTSAAAEMNLQRQDFFLQTKYSPADGQDPKTIPYDPKLPLADQVNQSVEVSLHNLKTSYLDSLVLHSPLRTMQQTMTVWRAMETLVDAGKVLRVGISNCYDYETFTDLYEQARIKPSVLQNRFYADSNFDTELRQFCKEHGIWYQSFWTLTANRQALAQPAIRDWAAQYKLTPQTFLFAFLMSTGYITPLSGTTDPMHMAQDVAVQERLEGGEVFFKNEQEMRKFAELLGMPDL